MNKKQYERKAISLRMNLTDGDICDWLNLLVSDNQFVGKWITAIILAAYHKYPLKTGGVIKKQIPEKLKKISRIEAEKKPGRVALSENSIIGTAGNLSLGEVRIIHIRNEEAIRICEEYRNNGENISNIIKDKIREGLDTSSEREYPPDRDAINEILKKHKNKKTPLEKEDTCENIKQGSISTVHGEKESMETVFR